MYLNHISLVNFKNYQQASVDFSHGINCFTGNNGTGKTNLLDAIHYLVFCKSYFNPVDSQNILHGEDFFVIQGNFISNDKDKKSDSFHISCGVKKGLPKQFKKNKKEYLRLADHIGLFSAVMISPEDTVLISGGSENRRKFIDSVISQLDKQYLDDLINYNKALLQRNVLLKKIASTGSFDKLSLEAWSEQMISSGGRIYEKRDSFIARFIPIFQNYYNYLTEGKEDISIRYQSHLKADSFKNILAAALEKDKQLQYSTAGTHKDDLLFDIGGYPVKRFGSQGQQKSFLVALKLAQFDFIRVEKKISPLLLLDDIFAKLDRLRTQKLMELVNKSHFGQIFITHTHADSLKNILENIHAKHCLFSVENGTVSAI